MSPLELKDALSKALERGGQGYTLEDLEQALSRGDALLWLGEKGALVTSLHANDNERFLHVWLGAGDLSELVALEPGVSAWARARGCKRATINGRKGWERVFSHCGFVREGEELVKRYV